MGRLLGMYLIAKIIVNEAYEHKCNCIFPRLWGDYELSSRLWGELLRHEVDENESCNVDESSTI